MIDTDVPEREPDWSPLTRAMRAALWSAKLCIPRHVERKLVASMVDELVGEGVTLAEAPPP